MALAIIDDFVRADEDPLSQGGDWAGPTINFTADGYQPNQTNLVGFECVPDDSDPDLLGFVIAQSYRTDISEADVRVAARITAFGADGYSPAITARVQNPGTPSARAYQLYVADPTSLSLYWSEAGSTFNLGTTFSVPGDPLEVGDWFRLDAIGTVLTVYIQRGGSTPDGLWEQCDSEIIDASIIGPGSVGVELFLITAANGGSLPNGTIDRFALEVVPPPPPPGPGSLFAAVSDGGDYSLYTLDQDTGEATLIGPIGFEIAAMAFDPTSGILYGLDSNPSIYSIDTATGAGTFLRDLLDDTFFPSDMAFNADGTLYATDSDNIYVIETATGWSARMNDSEFVTDVGGMEFVTDLWAVPRNGEGEPLQTINKFSAVPTDEATLGTSTTGSVTAAAYNGFSDKFFFVDDESPANLYLVDLVTGTVTIVGEAFDDGKVFDALAVMPSPAPEPPERGRWIWAGMSAAQESEPTHKTIMVSDDGGETWAAVDAPFDGQAVPDDDYVNNAFGLAQIGDTVVACGVDQGSDPMVEFALSTDRGDTWTADPSVPFEPDSADVRPWGVFAAEDLGKIVALCAQNIGGPCIAVGSISGGAITWELKSSPFDGNWVFRGCYSPSLNRMVVGGLGTGADGDSNAVYSDDGGETWTKTQIGNPVTDVTDVIWIDELDLFAAVTGEGVSTSSDGINWTLTDNPRGLSPNCLAWSPDQNRLAVGTYFGEVCATNDPTAPTDEWSFNDIGFSCQSGLSGIGYGGGRWVLAGGGCEDEAKVVAWSNSALVWTPVTSPYDGATEYPFIFPAGYYVLHFTPPPPPPPPFSGRVYADLPIRTFVTTKEARTLSILDHRATDRQFLYVLNGPAYHTAQVASDDLEINQPFPDADSPANLTNNRRLIYALQRWQGADPPYQPIFGGILMIPEDQGTDTPTTRYTAYDGWQYMMSRPIRNPYDGALPGPGGLVFPMGSLASDIALGLLEITELIDGETHIDWSDSGLIEASDPLPSDLVLDPGSSVGEAWQVLCNTGTIDIHLDPMYEPLDAPGKINRFRVVAQSAGSAAGPVRYNVVMGWDKGGRSLAGVNRLVDGTRLANKVQFYSGEGGDAAPLQTDATSVTAYGEYWAQQFFPGSNDITTIALLAVAELAIRRNGARSIALDPAPERVEIPLRDYGLGDYLPVWASKNLREPLGIDYDSFDPDNPGASGYQRVYAIPMQVDDNGVAKVTGILTSKEN